MDRQVRRRSRFSVSFPIFGEKVSTCKSFNDLPEEIILFLASFLNIADLVLVGSNREH